MSQKLICRLVLDTPAQWRFPATHRNVTEPPELLSFFPVLWSKIARQLPGRTDNEIKNFWRTRIQKQIKEEAKQNNLTAPAQDHDASTSYATCTSAMDESVATCSDHHPTLPTGNIIAESFEDPMLTDSMNDGFWSMEDIWTTQFFNGD
ncbi:hypothetical protein ACLOJK_001948 [Asimina triloba]